MKLYFIFLMLLCSVVHAQQPKDTTALKNISHEKFEWLVAKDTVNLKILLDDNLQFIHSNGWIQTRTDMIKDLASGKLNYLKVTVETDTVRLIQNTGIVTGKGTFKVMLDGKEVELKLLYTEVYVLNKKQWKLVQRNACKL